MVSLRPVVVPVPVIPLPPPQPQPQQRLLLQCNTIVSIRNIIVSIILSILFMSVVVDVVPTAPVVVEGFTTTTTTTPSSSSSSLLSRRVIPSHHHHHLHHRTTGNHHYYSTRTWMRLDAGHMDDDHHRMMISETTSTPFSLQQQQLDTTTTLLLMVPPPTTLASSLPQQRRRTMTTTIVAAMAFVTTLWCGMAPVMAVDMVTTTTTTTTTLLAQSWYASLASTGFYQAFSLVFLSEIGDKTFFIAGLLAMKTNRLVSFLGSISALIVMTLLSVLIGQVFHIVPTFGGGGGILEGIPLDDIAAALAFAFFGVKILKEALEMEEGTSIMDEEFAEAEETVKDNEKKVVLNQNRIGQIVSIFGLVFAAEFGDRSFVSTIALSAAQNPISVAGGAICAHAIATGIAVAGGSVVAKYLSEKVIGIIGGTLFLVFAATTVMGIF